MSTSGLQRAKVWSATHRSLAWDLLRIYLGVALFVRGALLVAHPGLITAFMPREAWFWGVATSHYVALAHLGGGVMLMLGLVTRGAALAQLPALFGAVFFVHLRGGFLAPGQSLELSALVLFLLALYAVFGSGRLSVDHYLFGEADEEERQHRDAGHAAGTSPAAGH